MKTDSNDKRKHLEFIQATINRLSSNTFLFKGWTITVVGIIFTTMLTTQKYELLWLMIGIILFFWFIDAYYLMLEKCFRDLYLKISETEEDNIDYKMNIKYNFYNWYSTLLRPILIMFYLSILVIILIIIFIKFDINLIIKLK